MTPEIIETEILTYTDSKLNTVWSITTKLGLKENVAYHSSLTGDKLEAMQRHFYLLSLEVERIRYDTTRND